METIRTWNLIILTGTSGAGKSTLATKLANCITTITTRKQRPGEACNAYRFISEVELDRLERLGETLWIIGAYGKRYSISARDIYGGIEAGGGTAAVSITPDYHAFLGNWCRKKGVQPIHFHLCAPKKLEQRYRLQTRDGKVDEQRITRNEWFETESVKAAELIDLHFIEQSTPEEMLRKVIDIIGTYA